MHSLLAQQTESTFVLRRQIEAMPWPALAFPMLFGLGVLFLIVLFRRKKRFKTFAVWAPIIVVAGALYAAVGASLIGLLSWWLVLIPTMAIAFFYVGMMYIKDAHSVHFTWAGFLGFLRATVYVLLGVCFLLPGCQEFETTTTESKILVLFDVSGSMGDAPDGTEGESGVTRQEKVVRFLMTPYAVANLNRTFLEHLQESSAVACYRFGGGIDDEPKLFDKGSQSWTAAEWAKWLRPDKSDIAAPKDLDEAKAKEYVANRRALYDQLIGATDVGGSVLQAMQREAASRVQAIIVISDGNSNRGDDEAIRQLLERAGNPKRPINIITIGVGSFKQPVRIRVNPLITPQAVRVDDPAFEVRVPVYGDGLPGQEVPVTLFCKRVKDGNSIPVTDPQELTVATKKAKFTGGGEFPFDEVVFKVNIADVYYMNVKKVQRDPGAAIDEAVKNKLQGEWKFYAKVPRHVNEPPKKDEPFHVSPEKSIFVNDSMLRILLFSSFPSRDYQFVRTMMVREVEAKRAKLSIYLQSSKGLDEVQQDVDGNHLLPSFPTKLERPRAGKDGKSDASKEGDPLNLKSYDVIIAFDPDWRELTDGQLKLVKEWVEGDHGGGMIFVAGPQNTQRLIPPADQAKLNTWDLKPIFALFPVVLARTPPNLQGGSIHDTTVPYRLDFTGIAKGFDFLKLNEEKSEPLAGWTDFFGRFVQEDFPGNVNKIHPERGFYNYLLVQKAKDGAEVLATFGDPKSQKTEDKKDQPFFVTMRAGKGKSFYIGSGEMWRLRTFNEEYHQRFWVKLARHVSSGSGGKSFGRFSMAGEFVTGNIPIEAEVKDKDGFPLDKDAPPTVLLRKIDGGGPKGEQAKVLLKAKKIGERWQGTFAGNTRIDEDGTYEVRIDIPGTDESITQTFEVKKPNVEMSDLRTNFPKLYNMATDAPPSLLAKMNEAAREHLESARDRPEGGGDIKLQVTAGSRMFYRLKNGEFASQCIQRIPPERDKINGALKNIWDTGPMVFSAGSWDDLPGLVISMFSIPAVILGIVILLMLIGGRWPAALGVAAVLLAIEIGFYVLMVNTVPAALFQPSLYGVLLVVPTLVLLVAMGILLIAERYTWVLVLLGAAAVYLVAVLLFDTLFVTGAGLEWANLKVDFTWMLLLIGGILSLEWFTRKMLRLA
jgi:hypothetical protein